MVFFERPVLNRRTPARYASRARLEVLLALLDALPGHRHGLTRHRLRRGGEGRIRSLDAREAGVEHRGRQGWSSRKAGHQAQG